MPGAVVWRLASTTMPLLTSRPASLASPVRGTTPMPTTAKSHSIRRPLAVRTRADRTVALERLHPLAEQQLDAVLAVHVPVEGRNVRTEDPPVRQRLRIDDRDLKPALARRGSELAADPAGADHHHAPARVEPRPQQVTVGERAQVADPVEIRAGNRQPARLGAGRDQQPVVAERAASSSVTRDAPGSIAVTVTPVSSSISCSA